MSVTVSIPVCESLFLRNPVDTDLGKKIIQQSIVLIEEIGFEKFTFKKLAERIDSAEPSIYRYFENKHKLLVYLVNWYWSWLEYRIVFAIHNLSDPHQKLDKALQEIGQSHVEDLAIPHVDESKLHLIVIRESTKTYQTIDVDLENREGYFGNYKSLCRLLTGLIHDVKPDYLYPETLASTLIESAHKQLFFARHLPKLTNIDEKKIEVIDWLRHLACSTLR